MFNIAQRGTLAFSTAGAMTLDRWQMQFNLDTMSVQQIQYSDANRAAVGDEEANNVLAAAVTGNAGAAAYSFFSQQIENVRRLAGKTVTVSFWANAATGSLKVGVGLRQFFGTGGSPSATVDINATPVTITTAQVRYSVTIPLPSLSGKTLGTTAGTDYTRLAFFLSSGANTNTLAGGIGVQSGTFVFWGVQLEIGTVATPLEKLDPVTQLQQCQRFYQVGTAIMYTTGIAGQNFGYYVTYPVPLRGYAVPVFVSPQYANASGIANGQADAKGVFVLATTTAGTANAAFNTGYTVSADL
jgi:hypothetical protein